ncbi:MAG: glycogen synthase GlgA [Candidatus Heimdallarchaeota archaeon]
MRVAMFASEMEPFIKTGGLGDVMRALPRALAPHLTAIDVFLPFYRKIERSNLSLKLVLDSIPVKIGSRSYFGKAWEYQTEIQNLKVYFISNYQLFGSRSHLYGKEGRDYKDNLTRFVFFCKSALRAVSAFSKTNHYDIFHMHDWQTALIALYTGLMEFSKKHMPLRIFTIHNLAYQGIYPRSSFPLLGIGQRFFHQDELEYWGKINLMKAGILHADWLTTVSPTYAQEIQTETQGAGLGGLINSKAAKLVGILNGVDYTIWDPKNDPFIAKNYDKNDLSGKEVCKQVLQRNFRMDPASDIPLCAAVSRLDWQKGMDLVLHVLPDLLGEKIQFVLLGTGDPTIENRFLDLNQTFPNSTGITLAFNDRLAHQIEAGADIFLMPSRYEPSGLNDKYSLRYGTVPIVHKTGGLADSIIDYFTYPEKGNGFTFSKFDDQHFKRTFTRVLGIFKNKTTWHQIMRRGMKQDFSWTKAAAEYLNLYHS